MNKQAQAISVLPFLKETEMFSVLGEAELLAVAENAHFRRVAKKEFVFKEGSKPAGGFIVGQGRLLLQKVSSGKRPVVAELLGHGDPFGVVCAARGEPYPMSTQALCESVVLVVEQEFLESLTTQNVKFAYHLFDLCRARFQAAQQKFAHLAHADSTVRVTSALLLFAEKFSTEEELVADVTREELSQIAGVAVETCIRITKRFEEQGILVFPGSKKIKIVDKERLVGLAT